MGAVRCWENHILLGFCHHSKCVVVVWELLFTVAVTQCSSIAMNVIFLFSPKAISRGFCLSVLSVCCCFQLSAWLVLYADTENARVEQQSKAWYVLMRCTCTAKGKTKCIASKHSVYVQCIRCEVWVALAVPVLVVSFYSTITTVSAHYSLSPPLHLLP